jgi:SpoVK/Ycf46/Vps4 family AAA+-type ATPase
MNAAGDLKLLLSSRYPLLVVQVHDEPRFAQLLRNTSTDLGLPLWTWTATHGLSRLGQPRQLGTEDPARALAFVAELTEPGVFFFADFSTYLQNPVVARRVKEITQAARRGQTVVLTGPRPEIPAEIADVALRWTLPPLDRDDTEGVVRGVLDELATSGTVRMEVDPKTVDGLAEALAGLSAPDAERLLRQAALRDGAVSSEDVSFVRRARAEMLGDGGVVEIVDPGDLDVTQVGGMEHLKRWLAVRGRALEPAAARVGLDPPRGVLLAGVPGCGKSLMAKALAHTWGFPLALLDPARLYGPYVGQSEERLSDALAAVAAMSPVVLWIDEIEKGFAAAGGGMADGGVSQRLLGTFLRWLQDRGPGIFVVATCNEVDQLPSELLRKGRFDDVFFVDLPEEPEREAIFRTHLARRHRDPGALDVARLAHEAEGFSGAEIEAAVVSGLYSAYALGTDVTTESILAELTATVPLSRARAEDLERLRAWASDRALAA